MHRLPAAIDFDGWVAQLAKPERRVRAKIYLREAGQPAVPAVRRGLHHSKAIVRRLCASILDHLADEAALVDLVAALDDDDPGVLKRSLHALACDRCKENECRPAEELFVPRALELLHHDNPDVRASAIDTLGKVVARRTDVVDALAEVARHDRDAGLRGMARHRLPSREHLRHLFTDP
jgi:HEAT repeat protein